MNGQKKSVMAIEETRLPPNNMDAEIAVLSCLMKENRLIYRAKTLITPEEFYSACNRKIYQAMLNLAGEKIDLNVLTIADALKRFGAVDDVTLDHLDELDGYVPTAEVMTHYISLVKKCAFARNLAVLGEKMFLESYKTMEIDEALATFTNELGAISNQFYTRSGVNDVMTPKEIADYAFSAYVKRMESGDASKIDTGIRSLDTAIKGLKQVTIVSASTGVGKTALALNIAINAGVEQQVPTLYLNYEMDIEELIIRAQGILTGIPTSAITEGNVFKENFHLLAKASERLAGGKLYFTDNSPKTIDHSVDIIHRYAALHNVKLVVVDYLGEIEPDKQALKDGEYLTYGRWVQTLKNECSCLGIKLVILAQLNREGHGDARMSKIGGSWKIAQKADVFLIFEVDKNGQHSIRIEKNRNGIHPLTIEVDFEKATQRIIER